MAGEGRPETHRLDGRGLRIAIVHGRWHERIADGLLEGARGALAETGAEVVELPVPGAFELPVVAQGALEAGFDGAVALGVIIRGGTPHFEYVSHAATMGLTEVAVRTGKPVGFGVLTLEDEQQGIDRAGLPGSKEDKGREAAEAVVEAALALRSLSSMRP
ncbi:6,7-dimethyl-8-ribityllumazine synthase [Agrococcus sp. TF02-05]|uniref:6,7-dimethyl-8-ribityllumazine synthase n=1 Tax=Agrococcus sp. TF02-05 TaxID=2815211 RepID=UPI001AA17714|nr:6,7-dimethyl-8-ribityllumazine synthase [Agrococcus sp. TF02-05]MBO1770637.1 6,7-dimethyl-8-ribityllumazine synthase [Agrococcus sp. TF02-05]